jgi:hypothetical protein
LNNNRNNRRRGRGNRSQGGNGNQLNRIDSRARGNAPQLLEKYKKLAQDAQHNGDRVQMEYYLQFADHYFRVIADNKARQDEQRGPGGNARRNDERDQAEDFGEDDNDFDRGRRSERSERSQRPRRDDRDSDSRGNDEGEYGQEGESFLGEDEAGGEATATEADSRPESRRRQQRKPREEAQGERGESKRAERADKPARSRKPRKAADGDRAGLDASILPPSIRGDDAGGESGGALETVD